MAAASYISVYIYMDFVYIKIYLSVLLLNSVAFGLLQRVDSQKSMLTWPEVLEMNVPGVDLVA